MKRILIIAGEPSADVHAAKVVMELKNKDPLLQIYAIGGHNLKKAGAVLLFNIIDYASIGIFEAISNFPTIGKILFKIKEWIKNNQPDLIIPLDMPDFNFMICKYANSLNIPVYYYISPQLWAWRKKRINKVKKYVTKMLVILPFEEDFYNSHNVPVEFVGHPLTEQINPELYQNKKELRKKLNIPTDSKVIGILPGSRKMEIKRLFSILTDTIVKINKKSTNIFFPISCSPNLSPKFIKEFSSSLPENAKIVSQSTYELIGASDLLIAVSGTVTLEAAIISTPMVVIYKIGFLTWLLLRPFVRANTFSLVNIIAGKHIVPELFQWDATPENIAHKVNFLISNDDALMKMQMDLSKIKQALGNYKASQKVAKSILEFLN